MIILYRFYQIMLLKSGCLHNVHVLITGIICSGYNDEGPVGRTILLFNPTMVQMIYQESSDRSFLVF